ncbi:hypothetical protein BH20ACI1_BH20ACI1_26820 [soil metagenome]
MNKLLIISILLLITGLLFFGIAGYCFWTIQDMRQTFAYYGINETDYSEKIAIIFSNLKFGIVKFSILGTASCVLAIIFFIKRKSK